MNPFENKAVLITGGSGSLGRCLLERISGAKLIRVLSRSEFGQIPLRLEYPNVEFVLGDVRDLLTVKNAVKGIDIVIHAAAFKFLNLAEQQPSECVRTNVIGSLNMIQAIQEDGQVEICVGISTDKVAYARNVYGCTKHIMEKLFVEANRNSKTKFCCCRYGNVLGTTGSVLTIWEKQMKEGKPVTVTSKKMTRFFFTLDESVDLIFHAISTTQGGEVFVRKMASRRIYDMAKKISPNVKVTGIRPGEKVHEVLIADYEGEEWSSDKALKYKGNEIITLKQNE